MLNINNTVKTSNIIQILKVLKVKEICTFVKEKH